MRRSKAAEERREKGEEALHEEYKGERERREGSETEPWGEIRLASGRDGENENGWWREKRTDRQAKYPLPFCLQYFHTLSIGGEVRVVLSSDLSPLARALAIARGATFYLTELRPLPRSRTEWRSR